MHLEHSPGSVDGTRTFIATSTSAKIQNWIDLVKNK